jgi:hypothetical protein
MTSEMVDHVMVDHVMVDHVTVDHVTVDHVMGEIAAATGAVTTEITPITAHRRGRTAGIRLMAIATMKVTALNTVQR